MKRSFAVEDREHLIRPASSKKDAQRERAAYGGMLMSRKGEGEWKPHKGHHVFLWVFMAVQIIFIIWIAAGASSGGSIHADTVTYCHAHVSQYLSYKDCLNSYSAGGKAGTAIGVGLLVAVWVVVDFLLAVSYGIYRLARRNS